MFLMSRYRRVRRTATAFCSNHETPKLMGRSFTDATPKASLRASATRTGPVRVVALPDVEQPRDVRPGDRPEVQRVEPGLPAPQRQHHRVLRHRLRQVREVRPRRLPPVAPPDHVEVPQRPALHRPHDPLRRPEDRVRPEPRGHRRPLLLLLPPRQRAHPLAEPVALLRLRDHLRVVPPRHVPHPRPPHHRPREDPPLVAPLRLDHAVRRHHHRPGELREVHPLLLPRAPPVPHQVLVPRQLRVPVPGEQLPVRVHLDPRPRRLLQDVPQVLQVVPRHQDALPRHRARPHRPRRRLPVPPHVRLLQQRHHLQVHLPRPHRRPQQPLHRRPLLPAHRRQQLVHPRVHLLALHPLHHRVVRVRRHPLHPVRHQLHHPEHVLVPDPPRPRQHPRLPLRQLPQPALRQVRHLRPRRAPELPLPPGPAVQPPRLLPQPQPLLHELHEPPPVVVHVRHRREQHLQHVPVHLRVPRPRVQLPRRVRYCEIPFATSPPGPAAPPPAAASRTSRSGRTPSP
eukprot:Sspe_Gene.12091::Locus_4121_Transcript_1_1_Confidence_1.000_Length_1652::g.12091::m.12091